MKIGALVLGILGGLIALGYDLSGYNLASLVKPGMPGPELLQLLSIILPLVGVAGGGLAKEKPSVGATLMGIAAIGILFVSAFKAFSWIPALLLAIGAILSAMGLRKETEQSPPGT